MSNTVLCVFEGESAEPELFKSLEQKFLGRRRSTIIHGVFGAEIFQLWMKIKEDPYLDIVGLLQERIPSQLEGISRSNVSEVFLFFDHDGHSHPEMQGYHSMIISMLEEFIEATESGKLYINYPMLESIRDVSKDSELCMDCCAYISENIHYKSAVGSRSDFMHLHQLELNDWYFLFRCSLNKARTLVHGISTEPLTYEEYLRLDQKTIAEAQRRLFENEVQRIATISSIPFFVIDFCSRDIFDSVVNCNIERYCSYFCLAPN